MTKKFYHVVFSYHESKSKGVRFTRICLPLPYAPTHHEHLVELEDSVSKKYNLTRPVVHTWQLMREEHDSESISTTGIREERSEVHGEGGLDDSETVL